MAATIASVAACGGDTVVVVVEDRGTPVVHSVTVTPAETTLYIGRTATLIGAVDADAGLARGVRWRSSDATKAAVDTAGRVSAIALGTVTIIATSIADTLVKGTAAVIVISRPVADVYTIGDSFSPSSVTVAAGDTVRWNFSGGSDGRGHNVRFLGTPGAPSDIATQSSGSVRRVFATAGTFSYSCDVHPGMSGSVLVR